MLCIVQELLDHAFLRPTEGPARPAPGQVGLTRDQLKKLLTQVRLPCICSHCLLARPHAASRFASGVKPMNSFCSTQIEMQMVLVSACMQTKHKCLDSMQCTPSKISLA
jgi:hypothetical protein